MDSKFKELIEEVHFRTEQLTILYSLLIRSQSILYPVIHLFGLTGTGKTHSIKKFMNKFCNISNSNNIKLTIRNQQEIVNRYCVYINCNELFYASVSSLFSEILAQVKSALHLENVDTDADDINISIACEASEMTGDDGDDGVAAVQSRKVEEDEEELSDMKMNDCACFLGQLRRLFQAKASNSRTCLYLVMDNAESLKYFNEASNLLLTLSKLSEYANLGLRAGSADLSVCSLFVSEVDWHSLISECDLMSKTEAPRPFYVYFNEYTKDQMYSILKKTAIDLLAIQDNSLRENMKANGDFSNVQFYIKVN